MFVHYFKLNIQIYKVTYFEAVCDSALQLQRRHPSPSMPGCWKAASVCKATQSLAFLISRDRTPRKNLTF